MTRTTKANDRDHQGIANGTVLPQDQLPKYFGRTGHADADPKKTKKNGGGKGNWGGAGEEVVDHKFNFNNARRRSNSSGYSNNLRDFKTKFDVNEQEPVFEETLHGPEETDDGAELVKTETSSSGRSSSLEEENVQKH